MNTKCPCGGKFRRSDIQPILMGGKTFYQDTDRLTAHWKCDRCSRTREQRKRQAQGAKA